MRLQDAKKDHYRRLAREHGYKSRAAFKLIQANKKYKLIKGGDKVVDFGAAPGGWLQVASELVGDSGLVVGIDIDPIKLSERNVVTKKIDVFDHKVLDVIRAAIPVPADVILSDLSPRLSGAWDLDHYKQVDLTLRVLSLSDELLQDGGNAMLKIFDGERFGEVRKVLRDLFRFVAVMKPDASRRESSELYFVCLSRISAPKKP